jgi:dipeptidase E
MRLFLSSQDLGKYADVAAEMAGTNKKAALIRNAGDEKRAEERNANTPEKVRMFEAAGFKVEEFDLRNYFGKPDKLAKDLSDYGSVWCSGGNTFILRRAMKASGFDELVTRLLLEDKIMYGGWSAGACLCAPSLDGIQYGDRPSPEAVPDNYPIKDTIWEGLDLIPFMIVPHCDQEWFKEQAEESIKHLKKAGVEYEPLNDGQVVIVDGDKQETLL